MEETLTNLARETFFKVVKRGEISDWYASYRI
jgi:hypothetical protein